MLAITMLMPLVLAVVPLASASPFTFRANQGQQQQPKGTLVATNGPAVAITSTSPATPATATATATPTLAIRPPKETHLLELRNDVISPAPQPREDGFAASVATAAAAAVATTTTALAEQAQTTAPPSDDPEADSELASEGYSQTTYYSCEAFATTTHCGWHVPIFQVAAAGRLPAMGGAAAMWAVGVGFWVGW